MCVQIITHIHIHVIERRVVDVCALRLKFACIHPSNALIEQVHHIALSANDGIAHTCM